MILSLELVIENPFVTDEAVLLSKTQLSRVISAFSSFTSAWNA